MGPSHWPSPSKQWTSKQATGFFSEYVLAAIWGSSYLEASDTPRPPLTFSCTASIPRRFEAVGGLSPHTCILPSSFVENVVRGSLVFSLALTSMFMSVSWKTQKLCCFYLCHFLRIFLGTFIFNLCQYET